MGLHQIMCLSTQSAGLFYFDRTKDRKHAFFLNLFSLNLDRCLTSHMTTSCLLEFFSSFRDWSKSTGGRCRGAFVKVVFEKWIDLKRGEVSSFFISNNITISWLHALGGFRFIFFIAWQWKRSIGRTKSLSGENHNYNVSSFRKFRVISKRIRCWQYSEIR